MRMFKRNIKSQLEKAITRSPVVLVTGARQTGKSTLVKELGQQHGYTYLSLDNLQTLQAAKSDPAAFIAGITKPIIIDEVQRVPEIFLAIKEDVDNQRTNGRYILTGSANPLLIPNLGDSLAGRMEIIRSMPLSQGELHNTTETFIDTLFAGKVPELGKPMSRSALAERIITGGFPTMQSKDTTDQEHWMEGYIDTLLQREVQELSRVEDITRLPTLLKYLATMAGSLVNVAEVSRKTQIPAASLHRYLALFQTLFILNLQPSWSPNLGMRVVKASKLYLLDSGLLAHLLGINHARAMDNPVLMGPIIENFVVNELYKQATWSKLRVTVHQWRMENGIEVDIVLEDRAGNVVGIEIKSNENARPSDFNGLKALQEKIGNKFVQGIVLYQGTQMTPFGAGLTALPISTLWS